MAWNAQLDSSYSIHTIGYAKMLGKRSSQGNLFSSEQQYLSFVGEESLYGYLALHRHELFSDDDFAFLYCPDNGRKSVAPWIIACALLLQCYDRVSDQKAIDRATFDLRWKVALSLGIDEHPFAKSTSWLFRHQLIIHHQAKLLFQQGITSLSQHGFLEKHKIHLAIDTSAIFGKGAVEDTYNLLAEGLRQMLRILSNLAAQEVETFASTHDFNRYTAPSYKDTWAINWDD
ncbi:MAG: transposase [bacterium]